MKAADRGRTAAKFRPAARTDDAPADTPDVPNAGPASVRTDDVRGTYDLPPTRYRALGRWCEDQADELGEVKVFRQDAIEAFVRLALTDETVSRRAQAMLRTVISEKARQRAPRRSR